MYKYKYIDLFSGAGGLTLGFQNAGFECVHSFDNWKAAYETHKYNFPEIPFKAAGLQRECFI